MWNLKGQTAIITGGSKGIGRATVSEFLKLGAEVLYTGRNADDILKVEDEFTAAGHSVKGIVANVTIAEDRQKIINWAENNWKAVTILVNNAGMNIRKKAMDFTEDEYRQVVETNLMSPFLLARELYPFLKKSGNGKIINVASAAATQDVGTGTPYAMSKAGLLQQTRSLAVEWARDNIRVNAVSPWYTRTPLTDSVLNDDKRKEMILRRTPLHRIAEPEEIASIIAFLAMDKSSFITGQTIVADGGMSVKAL
ncbi:SDR family oxidoreductase [Salinimicrobium xinjiangense]|uniref:SDR family oxidoreductase n=1 Tax=Salinimicrobium xinjiangense TaxID=438596 RepID=UPI00042606F1|nr:SDR family oxidoreductase [Salinimicrobium xinjiangense]